MYALLMEYTIRLASIEDLDPILNIYKQAREFMKQTGNATQWGDHYPSTTQITQDIQCQNLYILINQNTICGVFAFILGEDPTYQVIEGKWLSSNPYGTIHRVASLPNYKGIVKNIMEYCSKEIKHLRIDTHQDNKIMQHVILKNGFTYCGIIYTDNGSPRLAYEKIRA